MKLTKSRIDALRATGAERLYWDDELKGSAFVSRPKAARPSSSSIGPAAEPVGPESAGWGR